jgi:hypothetical protein
MALATYRSVAGLRNAGLARRHGLYGEPRNQMTTTLVCLRVKSSEPETNASFRNCDVCGRMISFNPIVLHFDHLICVECFNEIEAWDELVFHNPT